MDDFLLQDWTPSIGRPLPPDRDCSERYGSGVGFNLHLVWEDRDAGRLRLSVFDRDRLAWQHSFDGWTVLSEMLEGLASSWDWLLFEQVYPGSARPKRPSLLPVELDRLVGLDQGAATSEEYRGRHDWSSWLRLGAPDVAPLWIVREGASMLFDDARKVFRSPFGSAVHALGGLGEAIMRCGAGRLADGVAEAWRSREQGSQSRLDAIDLATSETRAERLQRLGVVVPFHRRQALAGLDVVRAAARALASRLTDEELARIADRIRRQPRADVHELDALAARAVLVVDGLVGERGFRQGRRLAAWLRGELDLGAPGSRFEPQALLAHWGVAVVAIRTGTMVEAVAFWSEDHGPAILLNSEGRSNRSGGRGDWIRGGGARATLAHEICHLLVDRGRGLPVAEALGGDGPEELEERAREFAAEVLLPCAFAGDAYRRHASCEDALQHLTMTYGVSRTVAALQILKCFDLGSSALSEPDRHALLKISSKRAADAAG